MLVAPRLRPCRFPRLEMPEVRYVITEDDVRITYQVFGDGPATVLIPSPHSHRETSWELRPAKGAYERLAANLCVATFDQRGTGMSDGFTESPGLEDRILDVGAVMDAELVSGELLVSVAGPAG